MSFNPKRIHLLSFVMLTFFVCLSTLARAKVDSNEKTPDWMLEFNQIIVSDLNVSERIDSIRRIKDWNWVLQSEEHFKYVCHRVEGQLDSTSGLMDKYDWHNFLREGYQNRSRLGNAVIEYERMIGIASVLKDTARIINTYHHLSWMYIRNNMHEEGVRAYSNIFRVPGINHKHPRYSEFTWTYGYFFTTAGWELQRPEYQDSAVKYLGINFDLFVQPNIHPDLEGTIVYALALARADRRLEAIEVAQFGLEEAFATNNGLYQCRFTKQISNYYAALDNKDSAYKYLSWSADLEDLYFPKDDPNYIKIGLGNGRMHLYNIGNALTVFGRFGDLDKSIALLDKVIFSGKYNHEQEILAYYCQQGGGIYESVGEYEKAAYCYHQYASFRDSINKVRMYNYIEAHSAQVSAQVELEKSKAEAEKNQQAALAKKEQEYNTILLTSVTAGAGSLGVFLFILYGRFRTTRKQNDLIIKQKSLVESAYHEVDMKNREILDSINYAKRIQSAILPSNEAILKNFPASFVFYEPKDIVAGDFYWLEQQNDRLLLAAADCTGHGVPGAMVSVICNNGLNRAVREFQLSDPGDILNKTREIVIDELEKGNDQMMDGMDIGMISMKVTDEDCIDIQFSGANNPLWIIPQNPDDVPSIVAQVNDEVNTSRLRHGKSTLLEIKADKQPIGKFAFTMPFSTRHLKLKKGDQIFLLTDGFADQFGGSDLTSAFPLDMSKHRGKKLKSHNLKKLLLQIKDQNAAEQHGLLGSYFKEWMGKMEQIDDVCIIGVKL